MNRNTDKINKPKTFHKLLEHSLESKRVPEDISCSKSVYCHKLTTSMYIDSTTMYIYISENPHSKHNHNNNNKASNIQLFEGSKPN